MASSITRDIYRKACNYAYSIFQKGNAVLDPDINDSRQITFHHIKDLIDTVGLEGFLDSGFQIVEASVGNQENNFNVTMGIGYADGLRLYQEATASMVPTAFPDSQSQANLASVVSSVSTETIVDLRRNFTTDALIGWKLYVLGAGIGVSGILEYTVTSNTAQSIVCAGEDMITDGVTEKMLYVLKPTTPAGVREDAILLNVFLDEVTPEEDSELYHSLGGNYENELRQKIRTVVEIVEDVDSSTYTVPSNYTDLLGNVHTYRLLGYLDRTAGVSTITNSEIVDARTDLKQLSDYVLKIGDTMTGDLNMSGADIVLDTGNVELKEGDIVLGNVLAEGAGDIISYGGDVTLVNGDISVFGGKIGMASGQITGTCDGVIDFANVPGETNDGVTGFSNISGKYLIVLNSAGRPVGQFEIVNINGDAIVALVDSSSGDFMRLAVGTPVDKREATNKGYVDMWINQHKHAEYVTYNMLGRRTFSSFTGFTGISEGNWPHGTEVEIPHNLNDAFVVTNLQIYDGSNWLQVAPGSSYTIKIIDVNTVGITNRTGDSIPATNARCCVIRSGSVKSVQILDIIGGEYDYTGSAGSAEIV